MNKREYEELLKKRGYDGLRKKREYEGLPLWDISSMNEQYFISRQTLEGSLKEISTNSKGKP